MKYDKDYLFIPVRKEHYDCVGRFCGFQANLCTVPYFYSGTFLFHLSCVAPTLPPHKDCFIDF